MEENTSDIERILEERVKLDKQLKSEFSKRVVVMFTDIKGSTSYYDTRGDIDGRVMIYRHNELVLPIIEKNRGVLIKTIGDATMSMYEDPVDAVNASIEIQRNLAEYNDKKNNDEKIHIRAGLNYGMGLVEAHDVYGDVVNVASRVGSLSDADEILLTDELYRAVKNHDEFIFRYVDSVQVKGKKDLIRVYRLLWHTKELYLGKTRHVSDTVQTGKGLFVLEISTADQKLKVSGFERSEGEERPSRTYKTVKYNEKKIHSLEAEIKDLLKQANQGGTISNDLLVKLKHCGNQLYDEMIPSMIQDKLSSTDEKNLMISIDDKLVHVPWELMYDGKDFLCQKFSMGRSVSTKQQVSPDARAIGMPLKMLVVTNPTGDLTASQKEGREIQREIGHLEERIGVSLRENEITTEYLKRKICNFDVIHYAGHAEYNVQSPEKGGWQLKDGMLSAENIISLTCDKPMPALIFSNGCQTGQTEEWTFDENYEDRIFGLANAFLVAGVQHYIGTFWDIPDETGAHFAMNFYKNIVQGASIGEAVRRARIALIERYGEDTIVWASYMLYGDPTTQYIVPMRGKSKQRMHTDNAEQENDNQNVSPAMVTGSEKSNSLAVLVSIGLMLILVLAAFLIIWDRGNDTVAVTGEVKPAALADTETDGKRISELVTSLAKKYRENNLAGEKKNHDEWSSGPVTMVLMDIEAADADNRARITKLLPNVLHAEERINLVERELLDKLLEELELSSSELGDPLTSLKIGRVLSARFIITGSIIPSGNGNTVILRVIDTETTAVKKMISAESAGEEIDMNLIGNAGGDIINWIRNDYPLKGRIISLSGDKCKINLGSIHGLKKGDRMEVIQERPENSGFQVVTGNIEIKDVEKENAYALVMGKAELIKQGDRIREIQSEEL